MNDGKSRILSPPVTSVTEEDFRRFLGEKTLSPNCSCCGESAWFYIGTENRFGLFTMIPFAENPRPDSGMVERLGGSVAGRAIISLGCGNCGYIRSHDLFVVSQWVRRNPEKKAADDA